MTEEAEDPGAASDATVDLDLESDDEDTATVPDTLTATCAVAVKPESSSSRAPFALAPIAPEQRVGGDGAADLISGAEEQRGGVVREAKLHPQVVVLLRKTAASVVTSTLPVSMQHRSKAQSASLRTLGLTTLATTPARDDAPLVLSVEKPWSTPYCAASSRLAFSAFKRLSSLRIASISCVLCGDWPRLTLCSDLPSFDPKITEAASRILPHETPLLLLRTTVGV